MGLYWDKQNDWAAWQSWRWRKDQSDWFHNIEHRNWLSSIYYWLRRGRPSNSRRVRRGGRNCKQQNRRHEGLRRWCRKGRLRNDYVNNYSRDRFHNFTDHNNSDCKMPQEKPQVASKSGNRAYWTVESETRWSIGKVRRITNQQLLSCTGGLRICKRHTKHWVRVFYEGIYTNIHQVKRLWPCLTKILRRKKRRGKRISNGRGRYSSKLQRSIRDSTRYRPWSRHCTN